MNTIKQWCQDHDIEEIEAVIPDITGMARGKFVPAARYLEDEGIRIAESLFAQSITGDYPDDDAGISPVDADMAAKPDPESIRILPWARHPTAQIIHDCYHLDGRPLEVTPRFILKKILGLYARKGWQAVVAPEVEFYLVKPNTNADYPLEPPTGRCGRQELSRRTFSTDALGEFREFTEAVYTYSKDQDLAVETLTHEDGMAQFEVNLLHGDPLALADQVFLFKRTVREVAFQQGMYATFMARPHQHQPGSSMHLHQSIVNKKSGKNIFINRHGKPNTLFKNYIAGLQQYTPAAMPIYAPNVNSYRRITPDNSAPINTLWGIDNRTVGLRVPISSPASTRVENRIAGADANPYLAIAASLASGYLGMEEKLTPTKPLPGSAYELEITLPRDLHAALQLMKQPTPLRHIFGDKFFRLYMAIKNLEYEKYTQVISAWERDHLLLKV